MPRRSRRTCADSDETMLKPGEALKVAKAELAVLSLRFAGWPGNTLPGLVRAIVDMRRDYVRESVQRGVTPKLQPELFVVRGGTRRRVHALVAADLPKDIPDLGLDPDATVYSVLKEQDPRGPDGVTPMNLGHAYFDACDKFLTDYPPPARC